MLRVQGASTLAPVRLLPTASSAGRASDQGRSPRCFGAPLQAPLCSYSYLANEAKCSTPLEPSPSPMSITEKYSAQAGESSILAMIA